MQYQGRSPLKDVARSVVMGAAMIPASLLAGCARNEAMPPSLPTPTTLPIAPTTTPLPVDPKAVLVQTMPIPPAVLQAPPPIVVRPRDPDPNSLGIGNINPRTRPTRGFSGGRFSQR